MYAMYKPPRVPAERGTLGTGWLPPLPDLRDYTEDKPVIAEMAKKLRIAQPGKKAAAPLPEKVDWREHCSPVRHQKDLGSCTAHAAVGIVEYFQNRAFQEHLEGSELFVYKATRNLMGVTGDTGAWLRNTMGALALCGVPPERYWPYTTVKPPAPEGVATFDDEPPAFVYSVAENFEALVYFCHDPLGANVAPEDVLASLKKYLAAGVPMMFGFYGFPSFEASDVPGGIPFPGPDERAEWGHAIVAIGYDDAVKVKNTRSGRTTTGALAIRNSWGTAWGDAGYGWLPYEYVLNKLALDFWSLLSMEWVKTNQFGI